MYKIKETIIVEGIYDKIKLSRFIDGVIVTTNGFTIYKNNELMDFIKKMAVQTGIVILTDSDSAGFRIRNYIKQAVTKGRVLHAYVPDVRGKEKRKAVGGKEGLLGVEGIKDDIILDALKKAGCTIDGSDTPVKLGRKITKADFMLSGMSGGVDSRERRTKLCLQMGIPTKISANMLIDVLNRLIDFDEFCEIVQNIE